MRIGIITLILLFVIITSLMCVSFSSVLADHKTIDENMQINIATNYLQKGSDTLTRNVRLFVLTKEEIYAEKYLAEAYITKSRDKAIEMLRSQAHNENVSKLLEIKNLSDKLINKELWVMRLVYESMSGVKIPYEVAKIELSKVEQELSKEEKYNFAKNYLLMGDYSLLKDDIDQNLANFAEELNKTIFDKLLASDKNSTLFLIGEGALFCLFSFWAVIILVMLSKYIIKPITTYIKTYKGFDFSMKESPLVKPYGMKELYQLGEVYNNAIISLKRLNFSIEKKNIQLREQKNADPLTGIFNRNFFETEEWAKIANTNYAVFSIDINNFKKINDSYGHLVGDKVLKNIAENIKKSIRQSDIMIRMGGDEILVIIKDSDCCDAVDLLSNRLEKLQGMIMDFDKIKIPIDFGYGYAIRSEEQNTFEKTLNLADKRMYLDKNIKKNNPHN